MTKYSSHFDYYDLSGVLVFDDGVFVLMIFTLSFLWIQIRQLINIE